jgi:uncharacterized protein YgbK (DUF1537 family)
MKMLIIADDLSGAADCAVGFAGAGHRTIVALQAIPAQARVHADTIAIDTDTRRLAPGEAAARTSAVYAEMIAADQRLYKKIDSTLRGNWAAEVASLQPLAGVAIVAPAYPATGRTVRGGRVYVGGEPLENTDTWKLESAGRPAGIAAQLQEASLSANVVDAEALRDQPAALASRIDAMAASGVKALIVDTQSEQALRTLASATLQSNAAFFWVGSGGLAREIAALDPRVSMLDGQRGQHSCGPILILVGSLSTVSERQCAMLRDRGSVEELVVAPAVLRDRAVHAGWRALQARVGELLKAGADLVVRIGRDNAFDTSEGAQLSTALASLVEPHFTMSGGLIATGGETARAMLAEARIGSLEVVVELEAGVTVGRAIDEGRTHLPWIVTKAGAFGSDEALYDAWLLLRNKNTREVVAH